MIAKLVTSNLTQRPTRTVLSILLIGVPVTLMLILVGLSHGFVDDSAARNRGIGADILVRSTSPGSLSLNNMPEALVPRLQQVPHVTQAMGIGNHLVSAELTFVAGIDIGPFNRMSGGFTFREGHTFEKPDDILLDTYYAQQAHAHVGSTVKLLNHEWIVAGIVEPGKLSHIFLPLSVVQDLDGAPGKVSQIFLKLDDPANTQVVIAELKKLLPGYYVGSMEDLISLSSADKVPFLRPFLNVIIGVAVLIGAAVASLSMYMAIMQRTREIGILKSLGASRFWIVKIILFEALFLGLGGSILGIIFSFLSRWLLAKLVPASLPQAIVPGWWPIAAGIAMGAAVVGALYPGIIAARQDPIEALAYE